MSLRFQFFWVFFGSLCFNTSISLAHGPVETDSVGVEKIGNQSYILHRVEPKETLFAISRRYSSPVNEIIGANNTLKEGLKIGQTIRIPFLPKAELPFGSLLHKVGAGETLFSISKDYGVTVAKIKETNKMLGNDLSIGQSLIIENAVSDPPLVIPTNEGNQLVEAEIKPESISTLVSTSKPVQIPKEVRENPEVEKSNPINSEIPKKASIEPVPAGSVPMVAGAFISHQVQMGETLFAIAGKYGVKVSDLITLNALTSNNLRAGQLLKIERGPAEISKVPVIGTPRVVSNVEEMQVNNLAESTGGYKNILETGQAERIEGTGGHKKYLVLHRNAPVGSIMRIKNEENDVTIFARVVGILPETGDNSKLVIKLSQAAFDQLKAVNTRFPVEIMY